MKFVLASYGSRGDIEPCVALGRELLRRDHDVRMAVPPNLVRFAESTGLAATAFGPDLQPVQDAWRKISVEGNFFRNLVMREAGELIASCWKETSATLTPLADGADLLLTGLYLEESAANIAEYHDIPLATLHYYPVRVNGRLLPTHLAPVTRAWMAVNERHRYWLAAKKVDDAQRRELGLPKATTSAPQRITQCGSLEIQAYEELCYPGLAAEWKNYSRQRPFVGALTLDMATDADEEIRSWITEGSPPIFFSFGSTPLSKSPADTITMIGHACARLGERALVCSGETDFSGVPQFDHLKVVHAVRYAEAFPACRAVVHHGGSGTTAASLRAGVPTLILWMMADQLYWGTSVKQLKVGTTRPFSTTTQQSLIEDLRTILSPQCAARARQIAAQMARPATSVAAAADLVENFARPR